MKFAMEILHTKECNKNAYAFLLYMIHHNQESGIYDS